MARVRRGVGSAAFAIRARRAADAGGKGDVVGGRYGHETPPRARPSLVFPTTSSWSTFSGETAGFLTIPTRARRTAQQREPRVSRRGVGVGAPGYTVK